MKPTLAEQRYDLVTEFHRAFKVPLPRTFADASNETAIARRVLHNEEFHELMDSDTPIDTLDALVDLEYITIGTQQTLGIEPRVFRHEYTIYFCHQRVLDELNKSQLCEAGLRTELGRMRAVIERAADDASFSFHDAFLCVHETNMKKRWTKDQLTYKPEAASVTPSDDMYIVKRADGKILKPPGWEPPRLKRYV